MELRLSKTILVAQLFGAVTVAAFVPFLITWPNLPVRIGGWIAAGIVGSALVFLSRRLFSSKAAVVIDEIGIEDLRSRVGIIPWEDIRSLDFRKRAGLEYLCLLVDEPDRYLSILPPWRVRLHRARQAQGIPPLSIALYGLSPSSKKFRDFLQQNHGELLGES